MSMTQELRRGVDRRRDHLSGGGYPNPIQNADRQVGWWREEVFMCDAELAAGGTTDSLQGVGLTVDEATVLTQVVSQLSDPQRYHVDADAKGDHVEHVLRQLLQAGEFCP